MMRWRRPDTWVLTAVAIMLATSSASAVGLPDGRAYELVSPPAKFGADVMADSSRTRAAADGNAVSMTSLGGFGDVRGSGIATEYLSERSTSSDPGTNGWRTHAITPNQEPLTFLGATQALDPVWEGEFSADLSRGVFRAWSPVTSEDPNVVDVENLYRRDDLRSAGGGTYHLLTACPACSAPIPQSLFNLLQPPRYAGASADFGHVLFESKTPLTSDAPDAATCPPTFTLFCEPKLYESVGQSLRLVGILPPTACGSPPCAAPRSVAGQGASFTNAGYTPQVISSDGSRIVFTVADGSSSNQGDLYERVDGSQTMAVNASERTDCADHSPCTGTLEPDPNGAQPATYQTASRDGIRVFFVTNEQLTNDDTDTARDVYMWDAAALSGHHLTRLSVDHNPSDPPNGVDGVIGASDDGRYLYFIASGQLVAGKPITGNPGIYLWHESAVPSVTYVGELAAASADETPNVPVGWGLGLGWRARVSPDGRHLLFVAHNGTGLLSAHGGVDYDQASQCGGNGCMEMYLYSAASDSLACASCLPNGAPATSEADNQARAGTGATVKASHLNHSMSDDGRRVFFITAEALVPEDTNGRTDVYEYDAPTAKVHLISTGVDAANSYFMDASTDGRDVFFLTRQRLVGWDTDESYDLYDARIGGGFSDPPHVLAPCSGDACRPLSSAPGVPSVGSTVAGGDGNVVARTVAPKAKRKAKPKAKKCRKGFVRKKVRGKVKCAKKPRRAKKAANAGRGRTR